ncbi:MAG: ATP-binding protein, partial [Myxococcales bacterium]
EINNPLAYVLANIGFAVRELKQPPEPDALAETVAALEEAQKGAERVRGIVRDLKTLSRVDGESARPVDLLPVLESAINMALNEIRHRARLTRTLQPVPRVLGDEGRLAQVFLNLLVNAAQAITEGDCDRNTVHVETRLGPGGEVVVEVRDTGRGIPPEVRERIFDPFFTTKPVGEGTGLGLSICHGIVTAMGGRIDIESEVGKGTVCRVVLPPAADADAGDVREEPARARTGLRILVIDDEPLIGKGVARLLSQHRVTAVTSASDALALLDAGERFDAVLCDLMMPDVSGADFYARVSERHAWLLPRIAFLTGGAFTPGARRFLESVPNPRLEKPFHIRELERLVARLAQDG